MAVNADPDVELEVDAQEPESTGKRTDLSPRLAAIARGEDPDNPSVETESVEQVPAEAEAAAEAETETPAAATASTEQPQSWIDDGDRRYASAYGFSEYDLKSFADRNQFHNATRLIDRAVASQRQQTPQQTTEPATTPAQAKEPEYVDSPLDKDGKVNVAWYEKHEYDEGQIALARSERARQEAEEKRTKEFDEFKAQIEQDRQAALQVEYQRQVNAFHAAADKHRPDFYGKAVGQDGSPATLSQAENDRRLKLAYAADLVAKQIQAEQEFAGQQVSIPAWEQLLPRAELLAFGTEIAALDKKAAETKAAADKASKYQRIADQQRRIRPAGKGVSPAASVRNAPHQDQHSVTSIMQQPEVATVLRRIRERGALGVG